jgi:hypothetical protein
MDQRPQRESGVGEDVGPAGNALIGLDVDQDDRRSVDGREGGLHGPGDRHHKAAGPDAADGGD